jgi:hypothetical protein
MRWKLLEETNSPPAAESNDGDVIRVSPMFRVSLIFPKAGRGRDLVNMSAGFSFPLIDMVLVSQFVISGA